MSVVRLEFNETSGYGLTKRQCLETLRSSSQSGKKFLVISYLTRKPTREIEEIFLAIPENITSLSFHGFYAEDEKPAADIVAIFSAIPRSITTLSLSGFKLGKKTTAELCDIFRAIPKNIKCLDLRYNYLDQKTLEELVQILSTLDGVIDLNLEGNDFRENELDSISQAIPENIKILRLKMEDFVAWKLANTLITLPKNVTHLALAWRNVFGNHRVIQQEVEIVRIIPDQIRNLTLDMYLAETALPDALPKHITKLSLQIPHGYYLSPILGRPVLTMHRNYCFNFARLETLFDTVPDQVGELTLPLILIDTFSMQELSNLGKHLPNVVKIKVVDDYGQLMMNHKIIALQKHIGQRVKTEYSVLEEKEFLIEDINLLIGEYTAGAERNVIRECIPPLELPWYHFSSYSLAALAACSLITWTAGVIVFCTLSINIGILFMTTGILGGILVTCGAFKNREFQVLGPEEDLDLGISFN